MRTQKRSLAALIAIAVVASCVPAGALAAGASSGNAAAPAVAGGWGHSTAGYIGKYSVEPAGTAHAAKVATAPAGLFTLAVRAAAGLAAGSGPVSSGQLVTFLRKVKTGQPLAPSGILSLFGPSGSRVLYLTDLSLHGSTRRAVIDGGSFLGVPIGSFSATPGRGGVLDAVIRAKGLGTARVRLRGFSPASS